MSSNKSIPERVAALEPQVEAASEAIKGLSSKFVSQDAFRPVALIVYGLAGVILTSVFTALLYVVLKK